MDLYHMLYLVAEFFMTILLYLTMHLFFEEQRTNRTVELISYIAYYGLSVFIFFWFRVPIVLMVSGFTMIFFISLNYIAYFGKRIIFTILLYFVGVLTELITGVFIGYINVSLFKGLKSRSEIVLIAWVLIGLLFYILLRNKKNLKNNLKIPTFYWISAGISILGLFYGVVLIYEKKALSRVEFSVLVIIALSVCFMFVVMYDVLYGSFLLENEKQLAEQERSFYQKQAELMQESMMKQKVLRHDLKNHLITLLALSKRADNSEVTDYVERLLGSSNWRKDIFTGNLELDSILNFKLSGLRECGIEPILDIQVPQDMKPEMTDMTILLGNLLDNAIEAVEECEQERYLRIKIRYGKQGLLVNIVNSYKGERKQINGEFQTAKAEKENHGLGLKSVRQVIERVDGSMEFSARDGKFEVMVVYPLV